MRITIQKISEGQGPNKPPLHWEKEKKRKNIIKKKKKCAGFTV